VKFLGVIEQGLVDRGYTHDDRAAAFIYYWHSEAQLVFGGWLTYGIYYRTLLANICYLIPPTVLNHCHKVRAGDDVDGDYPGTA